MTQSLHDLERDIEQSRAKLDLTIDRLQDKMTVSGVVDDMLGTARSGRYAPLFDTTLDTIRRNPVPVMLIAMGLGLLVYRLGRTAPVARRRERLMMDEDEFVDPNWANEVEDMRLHDSSPRLYDADVSPLPSSGDVVEPRRSVNSRI